MKTLEPVDSPDWLLAFDFDGTLAMPDRNPPVSPELYALLRSLRVSHKAVWGINTGRSLMFTVQGMADVKMPFLPDFLVVREREIYVPNAFQRWVPIGGWNKQCEKEHRRLFWRHGRFLKRVKKWVESETAAVWGFQEEEPAGIVASTASEMDGIVARLDEELPKRKNLSYQRNGIYLRFSHADYHKGSAMAEIGRLLGVARDRRFAIGDGHNDLDMMNVDLAAHLACPVNACAEVKERIFQLGGYLADHEASEGAAQALKQLFGLKM
ncbi:HAD family phosphatase [Verrucomicrobiaceae bacterium N1E253]|uniref:HAD family phosphatase n=1 Tax=Oceaniferula marina TaxID=2748318 RepID=A0A851GI63_9BACT|nr:HAD-IIB family hydrolase [Oceaniferula marina]NWK54905.1 HAD family phosphatase [Oceaniferula marina]